jgi:RNA polymerase sigma-70 factor, ECF subfamily
MKCNQSSVGAPSLHQENSSAVLVERAKRGDAEAFEALFYQHKQHVYSLCLRMIGNAADSEELTQEAFMQAFRKIHTFRGDSAFSTWLHRLAVNTVLMRLRKKRVVEAPYDEFIREDETGERCKQFGAADPVLTGSVDRVNLQRAVAHLPHGYRQMFILHDVQGYDHHEVAAILGCSVGNSKSQLHKARTRLRKLLQEEEADGQRHKRISSRHENTRRRSDLCAALS